MRDNMQKTHARMSKILTSAIKIAAATAFIVTTMLGTAFQVSAKPKQISETVSLANVRKNERGEGYFWDNINDTLTLSGLNIETNDDYGLKLPDNATVVLVGDNKISAAKVALLTTGNTTFKGNGTLTLVAGDAGMMLADATNIGKVAFLSGTYKISSTGIGITSDKVRLNISGGDFEISGGEYAIKSYSLELNNTSLTAKGALYSAEPLIVNNSTLEITANPGEDALQTGKEFRFTNINLTVGSDASTAAASSENNYTGGAYVKTVSTLQKRAYSAVFGGEVPAWVDYLLFVGAGLGVAAVIAVPLLIKRRKYQRRLQELNAVK